MTDKEINQVISQIKSHEINLNDISTEIQNDIKIIKAERDSGVRITRRKGFDIIKNSFFVEEELFYNKLDEAPFSRSSVFFFETLEEFYVYLEGEIYTDSCYRFYDFDKDKDFIKKNKIDVLKLQENKAFVKKTVDDFSFGISDEEINEYEEGEKTKKQCLKWIEKFDKCKSYSELKQTVNNYNKSQLKQKVDVVFFFYNYIFKDITDNKRFKAIMEFMSTRTHPEDVLLRPLCLIYDPDSVVENYKLPKGASKNFYKSKTNLKEFAENLKGGGTSSITRAYFDDKTHFYCEETIINGWYKIQRYFETFDEFVKYRKNDLKNCDFSKAIKLDIDFSKYEVDGSTKLPPIDTGNLQIKVKKEYKENKFCVFKFWKNSCGALINKEKFESPYFFDFVYFLNNDLSGADLLFCDGLENLSSSCGINFEGVRLKSKLCDKFNVKYETYTLNLNGPLSFEETEQNERKALITQEYPRSITEDDEKLNISELSGVNLLYPLYNRVLYITDIHLMHRLFNFKCKSENDVIYVLQSIINNIINDICCERGQILLIGGDVSQVFCIFKHFIFLLRKSLDKCCLNTRVFFVLGNHELWGFEEKSIDEITSLYREVIENNGMYLIQNEMCYMDSYDQINKISYEQLQNCSEKQLKNQLRSTRLIIFGGIGFSGYNQKFNADNGIYRATLNREEEVKETKKFEQLYNSITPYLENKNVIIFTHMPKDNWCKEAEHHSGFVYVSGHTHRNEFYDDGDYRLYSDNQIGYYSQNVHLKSFLMDCNYDCFYDYDNGIYEITTSQYNDFYRGNNIQMSFTRKADIYMLKKNGYYCFIFKGSSGQLSILNGGALSKLDETDIQYYYNHMDEVISYINTPLSKYTNIQRQVSNQVKMFGGSGKIHGCIIDIDCYNHIFVNPQDLTIKGYWALDMIKKIVYPDIPSHLKARCPSLYANYLNLLQNGDNTSLSIMEKNDKRSRPKRYTDTTMYTASRQIKKMQRLNMNILTVWYDQAINNNKLTDDKSYGEVLSNDIIIK